MHYCTSSLLLKICLTITDDVSHSYYILSPSLQMFLTVTDDVPYPFYISSPLLKMDPHGYSALSMLHALHILGDIQVIFATSRCKSLIYDNKMSSGEGTLLIDHRGVQSEENDLRKFWL